MSKITIDEMFEAYLQAAQSKHETTVNTGEAIIQMINESIGDIADNSLLQILTAYAWAYTTNDYTKYEQVEALAVFSERLYAGITYIKHAVAEDGDRPYADYAQEVHSIHKGN